MSTPAGSTCAPWATIGDVCAPCSGYDFDVSPLEDWALQMASDVLFNLTRRQWPGECSEIWRPCRPDGVSCYGGSFAVSEVVGRLGLDAYATSDGRPLPGWTSGQSCSCGSLSEVTLPGYPVVSIDEVRVDGLVVAPSSYRVDDRRRLVGVRRLDGTLQTWPICQRLDLADTEPRTWSIAYSFGEAPPIGGIRSAATLACQLVLACAPDPKIAGQCRLPKRVTSITRQNLTVAVLDPMSLFADGLTGLAEVDLWVQSERRGNDDRRASVFDPRAPRSGIRPGS